MKNVIAGAALALVLGGCAQIQSVNPFAWTTLLEGASGMENWTRVGDANWHGVEGAIQADRKTDKASSFLLSKKIYRDFVLRVEFWSSDDANSGIYMRCQDPKNLTDKSCYEANIFDQRPDPTYGTGSIVHIAPIKHMPKAGGKWNTYEITVKGSQMTVVLNGQETVQTRALKFMDGPIALQYAAGTIKFRRVQIRPL